jgi:hypothetical protein
MKVQRSLQQTIRLGCMLIFLTGCAAYGSTLRRSRRASAGTDVAPLPVRYLQRQPTWRCRLPGQVLHLYTT